MKTLPPINLAPHGEYKSKPFKALARQVWNVFLDLVDPSYDLMHWMIDGYSSTVRVTGRHIDLNEYSPNWKTSRPIIVIVDGFIESVARGESIPGSEMIADFRSWVETGIMQAFSMKGIERQFVGRGFNNRCFTVVSSATDAGLTNDELNVLWTNEDKITPSLIRERQQAAQKGKSHTARKRRR